MTFTTGQGRVIELCRAWLTPAVPLLLVDLDNTLIDRDAAFRAAAAGLFHGADLDWLMTVDGSGYTARAVVADAIAERFGERLDRQDVRELLLNGAADRVVLPAGVAAKLAEIRGGGWTVVIVTNGRTVQQEAKIRNTGLDRLVDGWIVSEAAGCRKPDPEIFRAAATLTGLPLDGARVIGDSPHADIAGAAALGLTSVWVSLGRPWTETRYRPTDIAPDVITALVRATS